MLPSRASSRSRPFQFGITNETQGLTISVSLPPSDAPLYGFARRAKIGSVFRRLRPRLPGEKRPCGEHMSTVRARRLAAPSFAARVSSEPFLDQKQQVVDAVFPWIQFHLAQTRGVENRNLPKADFRVFDRLDFDLFRKSHAVRFEFHQRQNTAPEDPHSGLRIPHPPEI